MKKALDWLAVHNLHDVKVRLSSITVLVMIIAFAARVVYWRAARNALY